MREEDKMSKRKSVDRRSFIQQSGAAGVGFWVLGGVAKAESRSPNEKLNVGCIGAGGRGRASVEGCKAETIVALVDIDETRLNKTGNDYPNARKFSDYREMLDEMGTPRYFRYSVCSVALPLRHSTEYREHRQSPYSGFLQFHVKLTVVGCSSPPKECCSSLRLLVLYRSVESLLVRPCYP